MAFLYVFGTMRDGPWVFGKPEMTVNRTITNNITHDVVLDFNEWNDNYHNQYSVNKLKINIWVAYEYENGNLQYGNYSYYDKLSTIENNNYPVIFIDHDDDGYLSIGDEFISNPSLINDDFGYLSYNIMITIDGHTDAILIWGKNTTPT